MKGHIEKRSGRYYAVLEADREHDAESGDALRRRIGAGGYRTRREADEALREALDAARRGWRGPSRITVSEYLRREWLPGVRLSLAPTTAALYTTLMEAYVIPRLGGKRLDTLTSADLSTMYTDLLATGARGGRALSPTSVRQVASTLKHALRDATRTQPPHISWNPADAAKTPRKAPRNAPIAWTAEQLRTFLDHAEGDRLDALWILGATSGMRRSELLGVRWDDLDLDGAELHVRQAWVVYGASVKTMKEPKTPTSRRTLPLEPRAVAALRRHSAAQKAERLRAGEAYSNAGRLVFVDEIGSPLPPERVSKAFQRLVRSSSLPPITLHGLRHTFATVALDNDVDVLYVAEALGHASPAITMNVYQHTRPERKAEAIGKVGKAIFG